jgi:Cft2 family RNA processing exonuclease
VSELACLSFGVGHGQEGICLEIRMGSRRILLDCGLRNMEALLSAADPIQEVDFLFCTHAHSDHARGILDFHYRFPQVPIYGSEVTSQLLPLNWLDRPGEIPPHLCQALPWQTPISLADDLIIQIWPAGHLPGAACVLLTHTTPQRLYTLFYSGDFFISNSRLVDGLPMDALRGLKPDVLVIEGTYGTARHPHRRQQENHLATTINQHLQEGRSVLLPTPTLGVGQELIMLLRSHHQFTGKDFTVWVDSTVATGCDLYLDLMPYFPSNVQNFARHQPLFWDQRILPRVMRLETEENLDAEAPCVVIGHREADLSHYCRHSRRPWTVLLPESFASDVATTMLAADNTDEMITLDWLQSLSQYLDSGQVQLETYQLTTHSDYAGTTQLIHNLRPQHVAFIHGKPSHLTDLAGLEELQTRYQLHLPSAGKLVEFPIGDRFLQPEAPDTVVEGEITQMDDSILLLLSAALTHDPRWQQFADTGIVQARWQGEELVIKGINQRELLRPVEDKDPLDQQKNCQHCRFMRGGYCRNESSPLCGFQVTPEGYCPAFEPRSQASLDDDDLASDPEEESA